MTQTTNDPGPLGARDGEPENPVPFWRLQLGLAHRDQAEWAREAASCVARYRTERRMAPGRKGAGRGYNIFFSNVETVKAALYGRTARPDVRRRFADRDPLARRAAVIVERALITCAEIDDGGRAVASAIHDQQIVGRGVIRVEYAPAVATRPAPGAVSGEAGTAVPEDYVAGQALRERHVHWSDYLQSPARSWDGVWWVAFRHAMTREELRANFPGEGDSIALTWRPKFDGRRNLPDAVLRAEVWEIWDRRARRRLWIAGDHPRPARIDEDPYGLEGFLPLPEPLRDVDDTETLVPTPPLSLYRDQADDLDEITSRISRLTRALRRAGVYDGSVPELRRLARAGDNEFIPVANYGALSEKGGLPAAFQTEDLSSIAEVLARLYEQRNQLVQQIYELTGVSDILRGTTDPNETLGAQSLKAQFGSQRLRRRQRAVQRWISESLKLKAEIIASHFEPDILAEMTNIPVTPDVVALLRSDRLRSYRIEVETDSTIFEDAEADKRARAEVVTAATGLLQQAIPAVEKVPELGDLLFEILGFGLRGFKAGRELEDAIERTGEAIRMRAGGAPAADDAPPPDGAAPDHPGIANPST